MEPRGLAPPLWELPGALMKIETAGIQDAGEILELQKLAYLSEAAIYDDYSIPPLTQILGEIEAQFEDHFFLKAMVDGRIVGSVRAIIREDSCHIGRLIVHPDHQNQGIGTMLMEEIERKMPAERYEIFTGSLSERNLYLYEKLGYRRFRTEPMSDKVTVVFMEKRL
jgi:GNAT superfamily N-acetyltransferase